MTTETLLDYVAERGLEVYLNGDELRLRMAKIFPGKEQVTDRLLAVLKLHRERIIDALKRQG